MGNQIQEGSSEAIKKLIFPSSKAELLESAHLKNEIIKKTYGYFAIVKDVCVSLLSRCPESGNKVQLYSL